MDRVMRQSRNCEFTWTYIKGFCTQDMDNWCRFAQVVQISFSVTKNPNLLRRIRNFFSTIQLYVIEHMIVQKLIWKFSRTWWRAIRKKNINTRLYPMFEMLNYYVLHLSFAWKQYNDMKIFWGMNPTRMIS